jgi:hypothetical protein
LFPKSCHIKPFLKLLFTKGKLEVDISIDRSSFVFCSVHIVSLYQFIQIVDVEVFGVILVNKQTTSAAVNKGFTVCLLKPILIGTEIESREILAIVTE